MWFYDPYEVEWRLSQRAPRQRPLRDRPRRTPAATPAAKPARADVAPAGRIRRLSLAARVLFDARAAARAAEALAAPATTDGCA